MRENANVKDAGELATLPNEARESLVNLLGRHGAESVVLAARPGHVLWSDDGAVSLIAHHFLPRMRRTWTQAVLADVAGRGLLADEEHRIAVAKLMGFGYAATHFDAAVILAACQVADWNPQAWPLKQALDVLKEKNEAEAKWRIAVSLFRELFLPQVAHNWHETVALAGLDRLAEGPGGVGRVERLHSLLPTLFGLHVTAEQAAADLIALWMQIRGVES